MQRIISFQDFDPVFESLENSDPQIIKVLRDFLTPRLVNQWISASEFGGIYSPRGNQGGGPILFQWEGEEMRLPGIIYRNGELYSDEDPNLGVQGNWSAQASRARNESWNRIETLNQQAQARAKEYNPFEDGIEEMPIIKEMRQKGMQIVSTPRQRKNGTLVVSFPGSRWEYALSSKGYIRRNGISGILGGNKPELHKAITTKEDLIPKITYVYLTSIRDIADGIGLSRGEINQIIKAISKGTGNKEYQEIYDRTVRAFPQMAYHLPAPEGREDDEITKGARVLGRMGIF